MATPRKPRPALAEPPITLPNEQAEAFEQSEGLELGETLTDETGTPAEEPDAPGAVIEDAPGGIQPEAAAELRQLMGYDAQPSNEFAGELRIRASHQLPARTRPAATVIHASSVFPERFPRRTERGWETPEGDPCPEPFRVGGQFGARMLIVQKAGGRKRMVPARLHDPQDKWAMNPKQERVVKEYELIFDVESWRDQWLYDLSGGKLGAKDPLFKNDLDPQALPGLNAPTGSVLQY